MISKISVRNIIDLKDYYIHQQDTQSILIREIQDLENEKEHKKRKVLEKREALSSYQLMHKGNFTLVNFIEKAKLNQQNNKYVWVDDLESGSKLLILQDITGFWQEHRAKIQKLKERIGSLKVLSAEALLVISRIAYQLREDSSEINQDNILQVLSFCGLRLEYITNVLFKNRMYRLRKDPGVADVGLKSICYASKPADDNSQISTNYHDQTSTKNLEEEEKKYHQTERTKVKDLHKTKVINLWKSNSKPNENPSKLSLPSNRDSKPDMEHLMDMADTMTDKKSKKKIKMLIRSLW